ncbi:MAG: hypothetical protein ACTS5I_10935 [Rhodanobacter sp.]
MTKHRQGGFELMASSPWWLGIVLGLIGYIAIRHGIGWYFNSIPSPLLSQLGHTAAEGAYAPLAWVLLIICWLAAIASFIGRIRRRKLLDSQTGVDSMRSLQTTKTRVIGPMDSPLMLSGSMLASLLVITGLSVATKTTPPRATSPHTTLQPVIQPIPTPTHRAKIAPQVQRKAVIYTSTPQDDAQLRDWKKRNAESMEILKKTTKEIERR